MLIVPTLRVGMQPGTLRVPKSGRGASVEAFPRRARERSLSLRPPSAKSFLTASHFNRLESLARRLHGQFAPAFSFLEYCL